MESLLCENGKRFCVSRAALSMMGTPKLGYLVEIVDECAVLVCLNVVLGLSFVLTEIDDWSRSSPVVMEQCQEALSGMYYLLQRFPLKFVGVDSNVLERILFTVLSILKSESFSRDCLVAAGVTFCVALQGNLIEKLSKFSLLSRLCLVRGILTVVARTILHIGFVVSNHNFGSVMNSGDSRKSIKIILYDAILLELCNFCENPIDNHFSFHALTVMQICLQQVKTSMLNKNGSVDVNYDPIFEDMWTRLLQIVWNNLEYPLSQTVKQVHFIFDLFLDIQANLP
ncbi:hypothetical protein T459_23139 [Capsicum annuum]|uniref:Uncharacterized protein n=1 Tax=Capsicum annuum TaxID=4072 RepID=A0A2G2YRN5_CAPAN|nr:hypothetical protein T459_23139 [Capsicum annuum]